MSDPYGPPAGQPRDPSPYQYGQQPPPGGYGPPVGGPPYGQQPGPGGLTPDERTWGSAAHWSALVSAFVALAFLGPLLVLLVKGNESAYVRAQAAESLNFQLSMLIYGAAGALIGGILTVATFGLGLLLVVPVVLAFAAYWLVFTIIGSVRSGNAELYRYPLTIRMVS